MATNYCQHIKANGEQCRRWAIWGLDPPRCSVHRLDGGSKGAIGGPQNVRLLSKYYYGGGRRLRALKRDRPETRLAKLFAQFHFLSRAMRNAEEANDLKTILRLTHLKTGVVVRIAQELEHCGPDLASDALEMAGLMVRVIQAERDEVEQKLARHSAGTLKRSPGYWAVYRFIKDYISTYHLSPTYREIQQGLGLPGRNSAHQYVTQLVNDGFLRRIPGVRRNIRLIEV